MVSILFTEIVSQTQTLHASVQHLDNRRRGGRRGREEGRWRRGDGEGGGRRGREKWEGGRREREGKQEKAQP